MALPPRLLNVIKMNCIKAGAKYNLIDIPDCIKPWLQKVFHKWEPETFIVFDFINKLKRNITVLDIGAYIGLTAIWLCSKFDHVICVDADKEAIKSLRNNLTASHCTNFSLVEKAVFTESGKTLIFGPNKFRSGSTLNDSTSQIKFGNTSKHDYSVDTINIDDLMNDSIGFIKCDIEGGEEFVLADLLKQRVPVYISFHIPWWENRDVSRFKDLFKTAKIVYRDGLIQEENPTSWLASHPFGSLLFTF